LIDAYQLENCSPRPLIAADREQSRLASFPIRSGDSCTSPNANEDLEQKKYREAIEYARAAIALDPKQSTKHALLGEALF